MIRALIADDEALARRLVREYLGAHADIEVAAECEQGLEAARLIQTLKPDLVFLDIQMPRLTGLEVLELTGRREGVIFTTAHDEHALRAFDLHAVDYLLKPFSQARFDAALARARSLRTTAPLDALLAQPRRRLERVLIRTGAAMTVLEIDQIDCIEAQADAVAFHSQGQVHLKTQRISQLQDQLDPRQFVRVHRSFLLNLAALARLEPTLSGHAARLKSGKRIPVSRTGYERLRAML